MEENKNITLGASKSLFWMPVIMGISLIVSTAIGAYAFYNVRLLDDAISTTGSAKMEVMSDVVKWRSAFTRTTTLASLKSGYAQMALDEKTVRSFLKSKGVADEEITIDPISMEEIYEYRPDGSTSAEKKYTLRQMVVVDSKEVDKITTIANDVKSLVNQNVIFSVYGLEYYYSKLAEARVSLLSDAIKDAKARAEKIAGASGKQVGQLKSASSGVVQVLPLNSVDVSDYGSYATGDIKKEIMVTVKASFTLRGGSGVESSEAAAAASLSSKDSPEKPEDVKAPEVFLESTPSPKN
jgi:hypothetical protein